MILPDTSVWIDHFRAPNADLTVLLNAQLVAGHDLVIAELAMGSLKDRHATLGRLHKLDNLAVAPFVEVMTLVESRKLYARGIGYIDANLLTACYIDSKTKLWTRDRRLAQAADALGVGYQ